MHRPTARLALAALLTAAVTLAAAAPAGARAQAASLAPGAAGPADAVDTGPVLAPRPRPDGTHVRWYGWQIMLADAAAIALAQRAGGPTVGTGRGEAAVGSAAVYALGGPLVHGLNGNGGRAALSLGLRLGVPLTIGLTGLAMTSGWGVLAAVGLAAYSTYLVMAVDWFLAFQRVPDAPDLKPDGEAAGPALAAAQPGDWNAGVVPTRGGAQVAFALAF